MNNTRSYQFEVGQKVYAIGTDMDAVFVGHVTRRGYVDGNMNAYAVSNPAYKNDVFLEDGLISAETAHAMIGGEA